MPAIELIRFRLTILGVFLYICSFSYGQGKMDSLVILDSLTIHYTSNAFDLDEAQKYSIKRKIDSLLQDSLVIVVFSHTDGDGSEKFNLQLSEKRFSAVAEFISSLNYGNIRVKGDFYGETKPVSIKFKPHEKYKNRRSIIYFKVKRTFVTLRGRVTDSESHSGLSAKLSLRNSTYSFEGSTLSSGEYLLTLPADNLFQIRIESAGYFPFIKNIRLRQSATIDFALTQISLNNKLISNILFYPGKSTIRKESLDEVHAISELMLKNEDLCFEIHGHITAPTPKPVKKNSYNFKLSENRGKEVYDFFLRKGISEKRMTYKGFGNHRMIYPNSNDRNRRVEILIVDCNVLRNP